MGIWQAIRGKLGREEKGFRPAVKEPAVIAKRFAIVVLVAELAESATLEVGGRRDDGIAMRKRALDHLLGLGLTPADLEDGERSFVMSLRSGRVDPDDAMSAMWRLECAGVFAWALGLERDILSPEQSVDLSRLRAHVPADAAAFAAFCAGATARPLSQLLMARHDWMERWFPREIKPPSEERSCVLERMRAIRWLTEPALVELTTTQVLAGR